MSKLLHPTNILSKDSDPPKYLSRIAPKIIARIFLPYLWHITTLWVLTKERGLGMPGLQWSQKDIPVMNKKL